MKIFKDKQSLQKEIFKTKGISFVPTMGGLHKGHISLIKQSKKSKLKTLVSIFVNPKQFNKKSDFKFYPRNAKKDLKLLKKLKINYLYIPTYKDIYGFKPKEKVFLDCLINEICPLCNPPIVGTNDIPLVFEISFLRVCLSLNIFIFIKQ